MKYLTFFILGLAVMFVISQSCSKESDLESTINNLKESLKQEQEFRDSVDAVIDALNDAVSELANKRDSIKTQILYRDREIDENIAKDSSNALVQYRQSLTENGWLPDESTQLTFREIGIGSKLMAKVPRLELELNLCDEQLETKDKIIADHLFIKKSYQESLDLQKLSIQAYKQELEEKNSFWYGRFVIYAGIGANYNGTTLAPGLQLGIGFKIWDSGKFNFWGD